MPPMKAPVRDTFRIQVMLWRFLAVEPCAKSGTELTLFDITRMIEAHSIREMFIHLLQPLKSAREQRLVPMNRRPRTDNQLEFADSLQCLKHLSPEWIYSRVGLSVWIDRRVGSGPLRIAGAFQVRALVGYAERPTLENARR